MPIAAFDQKKWRRKATAFFRRQAGFPALSWLVARPRALGGIQGESPTMPATVCASALFIAVPETTHGEADEIKLFAEIVAAGTYH